MIMDKNHKDEYVYFLYSEEQLKHRLEIESKLCRIFVPGKVMVNGKQQKFTEMSTKQSNMFPDCRIVTSGYKSKIMFTPTTIEIARKGN